VASKTLAQKLYIRPGYTVALLNAPKGVVELLAPLPDDVTIVTTLKQEVDLVILFAKSSAELERGVQELKPVLTPKLVLWFAYPKLSSKVTTDLTRDKGWKSIYALGYEGVASIAIDEVWSGVRFRPGAGKTGDEAVAKLFEGERASFLPIYEKIARVAASFGPDVEVQPRQSYVAFSRGNQFALVKPARQRIDLALKLRNAPFDPRLEAAEGLGSGSMTHRVAITKFDEIDKQVIDWLKDAYRAAGK
jgi:predicted transport protein